MADLQVEGFEAYMRALTVNIGAEAAFRGLCDRVTINETSFFRDRRQLGVFENRVLKKLIMSRSGTRRLRIWSAASSTGEEPYTLAMILRRQLGAQLSRWNIEVLGTDLSEDRPGGRVFVLRRAFTRRRAAGRVLYQSRGWPL